MHHEGTYESARKELRRLLHSVDTNEHVEPTQIKVSEYLTQWLETTRSQITPKTHLRYAELVNYFLIPELGASRLNKLDPADIQKCYNKWETTGRRDKKGGGLAARTRLQIHRILRSALKHAIRMRLITHNPADAVIPPRIRKATVATLSVEQSAIMLKTLQASYPRLYLPVLLAIATGMRRGEVVALRWKNVDFESKVIRVVESVEQVKDVIRFKAPKTEKTRAVMLPEYVLKELKALKKEIEPAQNDLVCCLEGGEPIKPDNLSAEFRTVIRKIPGIPVVRFHDLRHSHATQLLSEGIHPKIAQERLGHSSIKTTLDLYSHLTDTMQSDAVSKLDSAFRSAIKAKPLKGPQLG